MNIKLYIIKFLKWFPHQQFAFVAAFVFLAGLFFSRAAMSIGMMLLLGNAIINLKLPNIWKRFVSDKTALCLVAIYFLYALSWFWSEDKTHFMSQLRVMTPFVVMPFAFHSLEWPQQWYNTLLKSFLILILFGMGWSLFEYIQAFNAINESYGVSKSIPTPFKNDHIRFSLAVALAFGISLHFFKNEGQKLLKLWFALVALICALYTFILASKTGLISIGIYLVFYVISLLMSKTKLKEAVILMIVAILTPIVLFQLFPTFKTKMAYTQYSLQEMLKGNIEKTSDGGRILSYKLALENVRAKPIIGVGIGDSHTAMHEAYERHSISQEKVLLPHNQFLLVLMNLGFVGLFVFLGLLGFVYFKWMRGGYLLASFLSSMLLALMVESLWQSQYGVAVFLFFFLFLKHRKESEHTIFAHEA